MKFVKSQTAFAVMSPLLGFILVSRGATSAHKSCAKSFAERVAKTDPGMVGALLTMTTDNLQHVESHLLLLGRKNSRERVAAFLLEMNGRLTARGKALPMSRRDIADYLGLTLETVSRANSKRVPAIGRGNRALIISSAAGFTGVNASR